jgi:alpha-amylase
LQFGVFNAPLHYNFKEAGDRGRDYDLRAIWDGTVVQKRPIGAVTLVENHEYVLFLVHVCDIENMLIVR